MPIYEYRCNSCGHELEKLQRMSEDPLKDCPACENATLQRLISAAGFRLKGSGWYETDFKKSNKRNVADSASGSPSGSSASAASESKSSSDTSAKSSSSSSSSGSAAGSKASTA